MQADWVQDALALIHLLLAWFLTTPREGYINQTSFCFQLSLIVLCQHCTHFSRMLNLKLFRLGLFWVLFSLLHKRQCWGATTAWGGHTFDIRILSHGGKTVVCNQDQYRYLAIVEDDWTDKPPSTASHLTPVHQVLQLRDLHRALKPVHEPPHALHINYTTESSS